MLNSVDDSRKKKIESQETVTIHEKTRKFMYRHRINIIAKQSDQYLDKHHKLSFLTKLL